MMVCECGASLVEKTGAEMFIYRNDFCIVDVDYSECPACGYEAILPEQIKVNEARVKAAHLEVDVRCNGNAR